MPEQMTIDEFRARQKNGRLKAAKGTPQPEYRLQISCCTWFRYRWPKVIAYHVPNGERRDKATGAKLKAMGALAGIPDWHIDDPRGGYPGARLEGKVGKNKLSKSQVIILDNYRAMGFYVAEFRTLDEFKTICEHYMSLPTNY